MLRTLDRGPYVVWPEIICNSILTCGDRNDGRSRTRRLARGEVKSEQLIVFLVVMLQWVALVKKGGDVCH